MLLEASSTQSNTVEFFSQHHHHRLCLCALQQSVANIYALGHQTPVKGFHKENAISHVGGCFLVSKKSGKSFQSSSNINHTKRVREEKMGSHVLNNITAEVGIGFRLPSSP